MKPANYRFRPSNPLKGARTGYAGPAPLGLEGMDWPGFLERSRKALLDLGYSDGSSRVYRHILRSFGKWFYSTPGRVSARAVHAYICSVDRQNGSWSWTASNITALRLFFDKLCGLSVCQNMTTPKRPKRLPTILNRQEILRLISAADTARDQLLLGLLYGSGLKVGELCSLRWADVDIDADELSIGNGANARRVPFACQLKPLLARGRELCSPQDYIFRGSSSGSRLSTRMAGNVLRKAVLRARIDKPVCAMTLRHSYAVHMLQDGASLREVQAALGLRRISNALVYLRCILPVGATSPLELFASRGDTGSSPGYSAPDIPEPGMPAVLPFEPAEMTLAERALLFYKSLRQHLRLRFLALREALAKG